jgi:hypothetical protein
MFLKILRWIIGGLLGSAGACSLILAALIACFVNDAKAASNATLLAIVSLILAALAIVCIPSKRRATKATAKQREDALQGELFERPRIMPALVCVVTLPMAVICALGTLTVPVIGFTRPSAINIEFFCFAFFFPLCAYAFGKVVWDTIKTWGSPLIIVGKDSLQIPHNTPELLQWSDIKTISTYRLKYSTFLRLELNDPAKFDNTRKRWAYWWDRRGVSVNITSAPQRILSAVSKAFESASRPEQQDLLSQR